jgi:hypothetical protein
VFPEDLVTARERFVGPDEKFFSFIPLGDNTLVFVPGADLSATSLTTVPFFA